MYVVSPDSDAAKAARGKRVLIRENDRGMSCSNIAESVSRRVHFRRTRECGKARLSRTRYWARPWRGFACNSSSGTPRHPRRGRSRCANKTSCVARSATRTRPSVARSAGARNPRSQTRRWMCLLGRSSTRTRRHLESCPSMFHVRRNMSATQVPRRNIHRHPRMDELRRSARVKVATVPKTPPSCRRPRAATQSHITSCVLTPRDTTRRRRSLRSAR